MVIESAPIGVAECLVSSNVRYIARRQYSGFPPDADSIVKDPGSGLASHCDEESPMSPMKGPELEPVDDSGDGERVVSLCAYRKQRAIEKTRRELTDCLEQIHQRAIEIHNQVIERAELSVLTELCRSCGIFLDAVDPEVQGAVLTPAALYGDFRGRVFGKRPLQQRVLSALDDADGQTVFRLLQKTDFGVWEYEPSSPCGCGWATPLAGARRRLVGEVAGVILRDHMAGPRPGVYCGWKISYRDLEFIVFAHPLDRSREVAVRDLLDGRSDRAEESVWKRVQLELLRAIADPVGLLESRLPGDWRTGIRLPPSRRGLLLSIRRTLWRHFAEPGEGLTIHAHIAALADDEEDFSVFLDEVGEIVDTVTLKSGGLPRGTTPIEVAEVLRPFCLDENCRLRCRPDLRARPVSHLLLDEVTTNACGIEEEMTIAEALRQVRSRASRFSEAADQVEAAWTNYRIEQNLVATYGVGCGISRFEAGDEFSFVRRSPVLPNFRVLFDPRFFEYTVGELDLDQSDRARLSRGLEQLGTDLDRFTLADISNDERHLARLRGVSHATCNALRRAILLLGSQWRGFWY